MYPLSLLNSQTHSLRRSSAPVPDTSIIDVYEPLFTLRVKPHSALMRDLGKLSQVVHRDAVHVDIHGVELPTHIKHV